MGLRLAIGFAVAATAVLGAAYGVVLPRLDGASAQAAMRAAGYSVCECYGGENLYWGSARDGNLVALAAPAGGR